MKLILSIAITVGTLTALAVPAYAVDWNWPMGQLSQVNVKEVDKAQQQYANGEIDICLQTLGNLKSSQGDDCRARHIMAEIYREQKRFSEARKEMQDLIGVINTYTSTHTVTPPWMDTVPLKIELGDISAQEGNLHEAMSAYQDILITKPRNIQALCQIARIHEMEGDFDAAKATYKQIIELPTATTSDKSTFNSRIAEIDRMLAASKAGQPQQPLPQGPGGPQGYPQGPQGGRPGNPQISSAQGPQYAPSGNPVVPASSASSSSSVNPLRVATEDITSKRYSSAITLLKKTVQATPTNAQAHYLLGIAYAGDHQFDAAKGEYEAAIKCTQDLNLQNLAKKALAKLH